MVNLKEKYIINKKLIKELNTKYNIPSEILEYLHMENLDMLRDSNYLKELSKLLNWEPNDMKHKIKKENRIKIIDKIFLNEGKYELERMALCNLEVNYKIKDTYRKSLENNGVTGIITLEKNTDPNKKYYVYEIEPLQSFEVNLDEWKELRKEFNTSEWIDLVLGTVGYVPKNMMFWEKVFTIIRAIPMCEKNYFLFELGDMGTGKTTFYKNNFSENAKVLGVDTTVASLFYNGVTKKKGNISDYSAIVFDEIEKNKVKDPNVLPNIQKFINEGKLSINKRNITEDTSVVFLGNIEGAEVTLRSQYENGNEGEWIFPKVIKEPSFVDRVHYFIPGWSIRKVDAEMTDANQGFSTSYFAKILEKLREEDFSGIFTEKLNLKYNTHEELSQRDQKAIRKTFSGILKILNPNNEINLEDLLSYLKIAKKGREFIDRQQKIKDKSIKKRQIEVYNKAGNFVPYQTLTDIFNSFIMKITMKEDAKSISISPHRILAMSNNKLCKISLDKYGIEENNEEKKRVNESHKYLDLSMYESKLELNSIKEEFLVAYDLPRLTNKRSCKEEDIKDPQITLEKIGYLFGEESDFYICGLSIEGGEAGVLNFTRLKEAPLKDFFKDYEVPHSKITF